MEEESVRDKIERETQEFADRAERWKNETKATPFYQRAFAYWKQNTVWCVFLIGVVALVIFGAVMSLR